MDNLVTHTRALAADDFTSALPSLTAAPLKSHEPSVLKPGLELFHKVIAADHNPSGTQDDAISQYEMGLADGTRKAADLHDATIAVMQDSLNRLQESFSAQVENLKAQNTEAVTRIFEALLPALSRHCFAADLQNILQKLIDADTVGPVQISCAEDDKGDIKKLISTCSNPKLFNLTPAFTPPQTLRLEWSNGGGAIDYSQAIDAANALLSEYFNL